MYWHYAEKSGDNDKLTPLHTFIALECLDNGVVLKVMLKYIDTGIHLKAFYCIWILSRNFYIVATWN